MIHKADIERMIRHATHHSRGLKRRRIIQPTREWFIGLTVAALVIIGGGIYAALLFNDQSNEIDFVFETGEVDVIRYRHEQVDAVLERYKEKQSRFDEVIASAPIIESPAPTPEESIDEEELAEEVDVQVE